MLDGTRNGLERRNAVGGAMNEVINDNIKPQNNGAENQNNRMRITVLFVKNCGAKLPDKPFRLGQKIVPKGKKICPSCNAELPGRGKVLFCVR